MKNVTIIVALTVLVSGCVKLELNPGNIINDTIEASKNLYKTVKRNSNGEEERIYNHSIPSKDSQHDAKNILRCNDQIKSIITSSGLKITEILSESSKVTSDKQSRSVHCSIITTVKSIK